MNDDRLKAAYAVLGQNDPDAVTLADAMIQWVAGEDGIDAISLSRVQRFAWYDLSVKWMTTDQHRKEVLAAGAALFDALEFDRYAAVLRSPQTLKILAAHERSYDEGLKEFQEAFDASGINPLDLDDFVWGDMMGIEENAAHMEVQRALEQAIDDSRMVPGSRGWKTTSQAITTEVLDGIHPRIPGQSFRTAIVTERIGSRLHMLDGRSPELHTMLSDTAKRLVSPVPAPPDIDLRLEPTMWFLEYVGDGVKMTGAGYLPTAMVREASDRLGWDKGWSDDPPKKETDSRELMTHHQLLLDLRAIRHRKGIVVRTAIGSKMLTDPEHTWRMITAILAQQDWFAAVAEAYTLLLLAGENDKEALSDRSHSLLIEYGWRSDDEPPERLDVMQAWWRVSHTLAVLGGLVEGGRWPSRTIMMTPFGEATLLERLRLDVTGPMRHP